MPRANQKATMSMSRWATAKEWELEKVSELALE